MQTLKITEINAEIETFGFLALADLILANTVVWTKTKHILKFGFQKNEIWFYEPTTIPNI